MTEELKPCPSCHGLNTSCPDGCGRDPETGELNGTRYEPRAAPDMAAVVEAVVDMLEAGRDNPSTRVFTNEQIATTNTALQAEVARKEAALRTAERATSMMKQWRSTIALWANGTLDHGQYVAFNDTLDMIETANDVARAALQSLRGQQ